MNLDFNFVKHNGHNFAIFRSSLSFLTHMVVLEMYDLPLTFFDYYENQSTFLWLVSGDGIY